jgi:Putative peptidoglycan binding domain
MTLTIPTSTIYTLKKGMTGTAVFALQRVLNRRGITVVEDGVFGLGTEAGTKKLQASLNVDVDGVAGPATQQALARLLCSRQRVASAVPDKLLDSQVGWESGGLLAAVNWGTPGGVDCGLVQRRVYSAQYDDEAAVKRAFDAVYQLDLLGDSLRELHDIFLARPGANGSSELAWRLAVLNHNYPYAADQISRKGVNGLSSYWFTPQDWVVDAGVHFPDGAAVQTPFQWCQRYSLGSKAHNEPGQGVKLVTSWSS